MKAMKIEPLLKFEKGKHPITWEVSIYYLGIGNKLSFELLDFL